MKLKLLLGACAVVALSGCSASLDLAGIGLRVSRHLAERRGADREAAVEECVRETRRRLGARTKVLSLTTFATWALAGMAEALEGREDLDSLVEERG